MMGADDFIMGPKTDHELWIHKEKPIMCEYYFSRSDMNRTIRFSIETEYDGTFTGFKHEFFAAHYIADVGMNDRVIFPDEFEKVGDI